MRVLIDATCITRKKAGVGVYARNLIEELLHLPGGLQLFLLVQDDDPEMDFEGNPRVTMLRVPAKLFRRLPLRFLLEQLILPFLVLRNRVQVVHSLHYSFPLFTFGAKRVVTIHDMTFYNMPEVHEKFKASYFRFFIRAAARRAEGLIFVSQSSLRDCQDTLGAIRGKAWVVHHGKSKAFSSTVDPILVESVRAKYQLDGDFILFIGTIEPRKNLNRLVRGFALVADHYPGLLLVIAGMKGWMFDSLFDLVRSLGLESRVIFTGFVLEEEKPVLLAAAKMFVYPSLYEGFGIPVLEAMACAVPTITSTTSSLPEIAGDAALLIDPSSEQQIGDAMEQLLSDATLAETMRRRSLEQAALFTWRETAAQTLKAYAGLIGGE